MQISRCFPFISSFRVTGEDKKVHIAVTTRIKIQTAMNLMKTGRAMNPMKTGRAAKALKTKGGRGEGG
jgi:hypothetical protein